MALGVGGGECPTSPVDIKSTGDTRAVGPTQFRSMSTLAPLGPVDDAWMAVRIADSLRHGHSVSNWLGSQTRIVVENIEAQLKHFEALAERFRHNVDRWDDMFRVVLANVNPRLLTRLAAV